MALTQVSTDGVKDGSLLNADINASAAISKSKIENLINNNADNRVITGSGTANTLEGESGLIFDGTNLGVGITPDSHGGTVKSLQIGTVTNLYNETSDDYTILGNNVYLDGSNNKYIKTQESSRLMQNAGEFTFQQAVSGSADANITYTTPLKIDSSGNVCVNTTSTGGAKLEVSDSAFFQGYFRGTGNVGGIRIGNSTNANAFIFYDNGKNLNFQTGTGASGAGAEMMRIQSGGGISFNGDTAAANALDDYEEGTWTPNIRNNGATATWTTQQGRYVKIGQQVTVWFNADGGTAPRSGGGSGELIMTGLPFSQSIFGNPILGIIGANNNVSSGLYSTVGLILNIFGQGGTQVRLGVGGQSANFGINYAAGSFTYTAA